MAILMTSEGQDSNGFPDIRVQRKTSKKIAERARHIDRQNGD
jgi:hypothetical protein